MGQKAIGSTFITRSNYESEVIIMSKGSSIGKVRICTKYNEIWHGFNLKYGHLYMVYNDTLYVTAFQRGKSENTILVYVGTRIATGCDVYEWNRRELKKNAAVSQKFHDGIDKRSDMGISHTENTPLEHQRVDFPQKLTSGENLPYRHMRIPGKGRGHREEYTFINYVCVGKQLA